MTQTWHIPHALYRKFLHNVSCIRHGIDIYLSLFFVPAYYGETTVSGFQMIGFRNLKNVGLVRGGVLFFF